MTKCQITCKSLQKSSKCQNFLRVWDLVIFRADQLKKPPCIRAAMLQKVRKPTKYISSSMRSVSTVGGASRAGTVSSLCPGLTGLWAVKMHPKLHNVMGKRVAETHPNRIFPEAQKGQKPSASWASKPG